MIHRKGHFGFTAMEIVVVISILALLVGVFVGLGHRIRVEGNDELTKSTITILSTALEQYYDYTHSYPPDVNYARTGVPPATLHDIDLSVALNTTYAPNPSEGVSGFVHDAQNFSSIEVLYYYLNRVPASRKILEKLSPKVVTAKAEHLVGGKVQTVRPDDPNLVIDIGPAGNTTTVNLFRVVDSWQTPLRYSQVRPLVGGKYLQTTNFPLIESAGPDKIFHTQDDITSKQQ
jgi:hypothetical protein